MRLGPAAAEWHKVRFGRTPHYSSRKSRNRIGFTMAPELSFPVANFPFRPEITAVAWFRFSNEFSTHSDTQ
jgi:hypothetical protein